MGTACVCCCHDNKVSTTNSLVVAMAMHACRCVELGKLKCAQYWPDASDIAVYGGIAVSCASCDHREHYIARTLRAQYKVRSSWLLLY